MFFEPAEFPDEIGNSTTEIGNVFPLGFTELPGGAQNIENQVVNDHSYCC